MMNAKFYNESFTYSTQTKNANQVIKLD